MQSLRELETSANKATLSLETIHQINQATPSFDDKVNANDILQKESLNIVIPPWAMTVATHSKRRLVWYNLFVSIQRCPLREIRIQLVDQLHEILKQNQTRISSSNNYSTKNYSQQLIDAVEKFIRTLQKAGEQLFTHLYSLFTSKTTTFKDEKTISITDFVAQFKEMMLQLLQSMMKEMTIDEQIQTYANDLTPKEVETPVSSFSKMFSSRKMDFNQKQQLLSNQAIVKYFKISDVNDSSYVFNSSAINIRFDMNLDRPMAIIDIKRDEKNSFMRKFLQLHHFEVDMERWFYFASGLFWTHDPLVFGQHFLVETTRYIEGKNFKDDFQELSFKDVASKLRKEAILKQEEEARLAAAKREESKVLETDGKTHVLKAYTGIKTKIAVPTIPKLNLTVLDETKSLLSYKHAKYRRRFYETFTLEKNTLENMKIAKLFRADGYLSIADMNIGMKILFSFYDDDVIKNSKEQQEKDEHKKKEIKSYAIDKKYTSSLISVKGGATGAFEDDGNDINLDLFTKVSSNSLDMNVPLNLEDHFRSTVVVTDSSYTLLYQHFFVTQYETLINSRLVFRKFMKNLLFVDVETTKLSSPLRFGDFFKEPSLLPYVYANPFLWLVCFDTALLRTDKQYLNLMSFSSQDIMETPVKTLILKTLLYLYHSKIPSNGESKRNIDWTTIPEDLYFFAKDYLPLCMTYIAVCEYCGVYGSANSNHLIVDFLLSYIRQFDGKISTPLTKKMMQSKHHPVDEITEHQRETVKNIMNIFESLQF